VHRALIHAALVAAMLALPGVSRAASPPAAPGAAPRPVRAVLLGGSIGAHPANFGKFLRRACPNLEIHNVAKARLKARHLLRRLSTHVLEVPELRAQLGRRPWLIYLGGLNGIYKPERTRRNIAATFAKAHGAGFRVLAITLPPWGSARDRRWRDFEGLHKVRATRLVNDFLRGRDKTGRPAAERPDLAVDIFDSKLRDRRAALREAAPISAAFATSRYRRRRPKTRWVRAAQRVPRHFMTMRYRGRYHFHPNWRGHRLIATLICKQAPAQWGCDCKRIARSWSKNGRIRP